MACSFRSLLKVGNATVTARVVDVRRQQLSIASGESPPFLLSYHTRNRRYYIIVSLQLVLWPIEVCASKERDIIRYKATFQLRHRLPLNYFEIMRIRMI